MNTWDDILKANNAEILRWAEEQRWARAMMACQQDPKWHAEGDVWTHTRMVCGELESLAEWNTLNRREQLELLFTGLFHDSGKPETTLIDPETGRTRSPKHSLVGAALARNVLRDLGADLKTREAIVQLVRYHGRPPYLLEKESAEQEIISLSWQVNHRLLYLFALADTRGRHSEERTRPEENIQLWKMVAEENDCFISSYPFKNDQARFLFYREALSSLYYTPREEFRCTVTLMAGLPGAGKNTWLEREQPKLPSVALDDIREELDVDATDNQGGVIQAARERCRQYLRTGTDFAFNATNTTRQTRRKWIELFTDYNARIQIVYLEPPMQTILEQNRQRPDPVPEKVISRLLEKLEPPMLTECHGLTMVQGR